MATKKCKECKTSAVELEECFGCGESICDEHMELEPVLSVTEEALPYCRDCYAELMEIEETLFDTTGLRPP